MDAVATLKALETMAMSLPVDVHAEVYHCLRTASLALKDKREWSKRSGAEAVISYALKLAETRSKMP